MPAPYSLNVRLDIHNYCQKNPAASLAEVGAVFGVSRDSVREFKRKYPEAPITKWTASRRRHTMVEIVEAGYATPCWLWRGSVSHNGYARVMRDGKCQCAHKYFWQVVNGPLAKGHNLDHLCRNRNCIRLDHLEDVTALQNALRGSLTKFPDSTVDRVRDLGKSTMKHRDIGKLVGMSQNHVSAIIRGESRWERVQPPQGA